MNTLSTEASDKLRPGTEYIRPVVWANYSAGAVATSSWSNFRIEATNNKLSVVENAPVGTFLGKILVQGIGPLSFSLLESTGPFQINASSGVITTNGEIDYEDGPSRTFKVRVTDANGTSLDQTY
jgi:hypothetical protein